jgi:hypothetical protein
MRSVPNANKVLIEKKWKRLICIDSEKDEMERKRAHEASSKGSRVATSHSRMRFSAFHRDFRVVGKIVQGKPNAQWKRHALTGCGNRRQAFARGSKEVVLENT